jgi:hypothetical protein
MFESSAELLNRWDVLPVVLTHHCRMYQDIAGGAYAVKHYFLYIRKQCLINKLLFRLVGADRLHPVATTRSRFAAP